MDKQNEDLKKFFLKLFFFSLPFIAISSVYFAADPFKVLHKYDDYYVNCYIEPCRDYVSTELYLKNRGTMHYDSFVFGSSRSKCFECRDWKKTDNDAVCFHFDASTENLYGIWAKVKLIDAQNDALRRALVILDRETFKSVEDIPGHLFMKHPALSGRTPVSFHLAFFTAYFEKLFFVKFIDFSLFHHWHKYMGDVIYKEPIKNDPIFNDSEGGQPGTDQSDTEEYYIKMKDIFYPRDKVDHDSAEPVIDAKRIAMLKDMAAVFEKHHTRFKVIISPLYEQIYFNKQDLKTLQDIFGQENVLDYSGVNEFTADVHNYLETSHYKPKVAREILRRIYSQAS